MKTPVTAYIFGERGIITMRRTISTIDRQVFDSAEHAKKSDLPFSIRVATPGCPEGELVVGRVRHIMLQAPYAGLDEWVISLEVPDDAAERNELARCEQARHDATRDYLISKIKREAEFAAITPESEMDKFLTRFGALYSQPPR